MRNQLALLALLVAWPGWAGAQEPHVLHTVQTKSATSSAINTDAVLWTPASGKSVSVMGCAVSSGGAQQTLIEINNQPVLPNIYTAADTVFQIAPGNFPLKTGTADQTVTYTTTSDTTTTIVCTGYEFQG